MGLWDSLRAFFAPTPASNPERREWRFVDDGEWLARLDTPGTLGVYADWLEEHGDARFELIRRFGTERFTPFLEANAEALFGPLAKSLLLDPTTRLRAGRRAQLEPHWQGGVLRGVSVRTERVLDDTLTLLRLPIARTVRRLAFGVPLDSLLDEAPAKELATLTPRIDELFFGDFVYPDECEMSWARLEDLSRVWKTFPALQRFKARGLVESLGEIDAPVLTHFARETSGLTKAELRSITTARWPKLTHLEVWFGDTNYGAECDVRDVEPLLQRSMPALVSLGLCNFEFCDLLLERLLASPLLRQLKRLDLSKGALGAEGVSLLVKNRAAFEHLEVLDLSECQLSPTEVAQLEGLCAVVNLDDQREPWDDDGSARYVAVGE
jgi:hypothetical protein